MNLLEFIKENARKQPKRIVLPEGDEERTLKAADEALKNGYAEIILLGNPEDILRQATENGLEHIGKARIVDPENFDSAPKYIEELVELRKKKGMTPEQAGQLLKDPLHLATMMIKMGDADGEVAGARNATGDVLRPAFQYVKTLPGITVVSGAFIMILPEKTYGEDGMLIFADCAVFPDPDEKQLAEIAVATAHTARAIAKIEPRIAMLSFSTKGSAQHEAVDKVIAATKIAREMEPTLQIDGELQADAALVEAIGRKRHPAVILPAGPMYWCFRTSMPETLVISSCSGWPMPKPSARYCRAWQRQSTTCQEVVLLRIL